MRRTLLIAIVACLMARPTLAEPATQPSAVVGTVFGKPVTAADIGLTAPIDTTVTFDSRDTQRWELMGRILQQFGSPVNDAFGKQENVAPTPTEIEAFKAKMRDGMQRMTSDAEKRANDMRKQLNELEADSPERPKLEVRVAQAEQMAASLKAAATQRADVSDTMAVAFVNASKIEKALYRKYGGRVIFQQAGPEAIDARRTLYEAAEKSGDLTFADPGVRHLFYYYYTQMRHTPLNQKTIDKWLAGDL